MVPIRIAVGDVCLDGELNDTECARALARVLPLAAPFRVWGDALHFDVALDTAPSGRPDKAVHVGDLGLSHEDSTLCLFFGPTPLSPAEDPVAALPVTVVGRVQRVERLRAGKEAGQITVQADAGQEP